MSRVQIDSHTQFAPGWDRRMINMYTKLQKCNPKVGPCLPGFTACVTTSWRHAESSCHVLSGLGSNVST